MRISVGNLLTIRGHDFKAQGQAQHRHLPGRQRPHRVRQAAPRQLAPSWSCACPRAVARLLTVKNSKQRPDAAEAARAGGQVQRYTIAAALAGRDRRRRRRRRRHAAKVCKDDSDHDNDLLPNDLELQIGTDPCLADTDDDHMTDGWEYYAAKDLNIKAVPYPGKRPFPNALDPLGRRLGGRPARTTSTATA